MQTKTGVSEPCKQDGVTLSNVMTDRLNELECIDEKKISMRDKKKIIVTKSMRRQRTRRDNG
jgi:hypothetical protein